MSDKKALEGAREPIPGAALDRQGSNVATGPDKYKVGDTASCGKKIGFIYGQSGHAIVFEGVDGGIYWEVPNSVLTEAQAAANTKFDELCAALTASLPKPRHAQINTALAYAFFRALCETKSGDAEHQFADVASWLRREALSEAKVQTIVAALWVTAPIVLIASICALRLTDEVARNFSVGILAGALGALTSTLQRASTLRLRPFETAKHVRLQGSTRIGLGVIFSAFAMAASHAGILLPEATSTLWTVAVTAFLAGFSERLVPEFLGKVEGQGLGESK